MSCPGRLPLTAALLVSMSAVLVLPGCIGLVIGAGAAAGVAAAEERGFEAAVDDTKIRTEISEKWFRRDAEMFRRLTLNISEGRVMITGTVPNADLQAEAVALAWQAAGVKAVLNETEVGSNDAIDYSRDVVIANTLRTKLLFDSDVRNINYSYDVVNSVIYIIGIAQNEAELDRVLGYARNIGNVKRVVSHIRLKNDPRRGVS